MAAYFSVALRWFDVTTYGADPTGVSDSTSAIQAAINAAGTAGGGTVYFPNGVYLIGGAMQNTGQENSQLTLPRVDFSAANPLKIRLVGQTPPFPSFWPGNRTENTGPILVSSYTGGNGTQSILAGYSTFILVNHFDCLDLTIENLGFRCPINPTLSALNLGNVMCCSLDQVLCDVGGTSSVVYPWTQPTTAGASGVIFPLLDNGAVIRVGRLTVNGYYYGVQMTEHLTGECITTFGCQYAGTLLDSYHSIALQRFGSHFNANGITVLASAPTNPRITIANYAIEQTTNAASAAASPASWPSRDGPTGYDWIDAGNIAKGIVNYAVVKSAVGLSAATWRVNGGGGMTFTSLG